MKKRSGAWRARIAQHLVGITGEADAVPYFQAAVSDLWDQPRTRKEFADPWDVFGELIQGLALVFVGSLSSQSGTPSIEFPPIVAEHLLDSYRKMRGDLHEILARWRMRPEWRDALERHQKLLPQRSMWSGPVRSMILTLSDDPQAPDLDTLPPSLQGAAEARAHREANWRTDLAAHEVGDAAVSEWVAAVVDELWKDPEVRRDYGTEVDFATRMLDALLYSANAFIDYASAEDKNETDDETIGLDDTHPLALEGLLRLNNYMVHLRHHPEWVHVMEDRVHLLPEGRWRDSIEALCGVVMHLNETEGPPPREGSSYFGNHAATLGEEEEEAGMLGPGRAWRERVSIDMSDSTYIRKHWRLELRRHEDVSESLAVWIEAVTDRVTALGAEGSRFSLARMPPHTFAFFLLESLRIARASRGAGGDLRAEDLAEARRILRWDDVQNAMRTHAAGLTPEDLADVQSLLTHAAPAVPASVTGRVRKSSEWRFVEEMDAPGSFVCWLETVAEELEADPSVRERYGRPGSTLHVLVSAISIAGLLYVAQRPVHKAARADFQKTVAMLRENPIWMETMRRHAAMLTEGWYPDALEGLRLAVAGTRPPRA